MDRHAARGQEMLKVAVVVMSGSRVLAVFSAVLTVVQR